MRRIVRECIDRFLAENAVKVISEDSAEGAVWKGKYYAYYREEDQCFVFFVMRNGEVILGDGSNRQTHEEVMLLHCYDLLDREPPLKEWNGRLDFNKALREIEIGCERLFNSVYDNIAVQGRVFLTEEGDYVFSCYEALGEEQAVDMMWRVARAARLPKEKCYYVGHYDKLIVPLFAKYPLFIKKKHGKIS